MKRANLYALIIVTTLLLLFCLAAAAANAEEVGNGESNVTQLGGLIDELFARVARLDERITTIEDADQQDELWDTLNDLDRLVGALELELLSVGDMSDRLADLEAIWDGPGPAYLDNGHCILAIPGHGGLRLTLQHETIVRYMARFDALPAAYNVHSVQVDPESGETLIFYETRDERPLYVIERWHGCEFRGSSDWMAAEG
ncbi:MAG: hypothetical protein F4Z82_00935 [Caldilineaceae bacterium SB0668_bin_21]|nr:hypothetical protein [Caldilineaceae bacterium SB0668_bin_21]MYC24201.1 hypothetical protein [Caldilineaceae bacterium SB0662_bin_25]